MTMRRNDYYGDRKVADMFAVSKIQVLAAKIGEQDFDLQDIRYCLGCERFFDATNFIATVEFLSQSEFVCANCSDKFEAGNTDYKEWFFRHCEGNYQELKTEYKLKLKIAKQTCHCMTNAAGEVETPSGSCAIHSYLVKQ